MISPERKLLPMTDAFRRYWVEDPQDKPNEVRGKLLLALEAARQQGIEINDGNIHSFGKHLSERSIFYLRFFRPLDHEPYNSELANDWNWLRERGFTEEQKENGVVRVVPTDKGREWCKKNFFEKPEHFVILMAHAEKIMDNFTAYTSGT